MNKYYNKDKVKIYNKRYREENKEYLKNQKKKAYALQFKNKIKNSVAVICVCGKRMNQGSLLKHMRSPYHLRMLESFELFFV